MEFIKNLKKYFTPKSRSEIIEQKVSELMADILTSDFSNKEIAIIVKTMAADTVSVLKHRKELIESELVETAFAINSL